MTDTPVDLNPTSNPNNTFGKGCCSIHNLKAKCDSLIHCGTVLLVILINMRLLIIIDVVARVALGF